MVYDIHFHLFWLIIISKVINRERFSFIKTVYMACNDLLLLHVDMIYAKCLTGKLNESL